MHGVVCYPDGCPTTTVVTTSTVVAQPPAGHPVVAGSSLPLTGGDLIGLGAFGCVVALVGAAMSRRRKEHRGDRASRAS